MKNSRFLTILTLLFLNAIYLQGQDKSLFTITGHIAGISEGERVVLFSYDRDKVIDSTLIKNQEFKFKGKLSHSPELLSIEFPVAGNKSIQLLLGNENLSIEGNINSPDKLRFSGSSYQPGWHRVTQMGSVFQAKIDSLNKLEGEPNTKLRRQYFDDWDEAIIKYIKSNLKNYESLIRLNDLKAYVPKDTLRALYSRLPAAHQKSSYGKLIYNYLIALKRGDHYFDFSSLTSEGITKRFSEVRNPKYTLLVFGAAWCQPCKMSRPELKEIHNTFRNQLSIVYYSVDGNKDTWLASIKEDALPYTCFWGGSKSTLPAKYGFASYPGVVLLNPAGEIINLASGYTSGKYLTLVKEHIPTP